MVLGLPLEQLALAGTLGTMFTLGVLHALEPAHGKLVMSGVFANQAGRPRDAILLSVLLVIFQMLTMMLLASVIGFLSFKFFHGQLAQLGESIEPWIDALGGVFLIIIGGFMIAHQRGHHMNRDKCCGGETPEAKPQHSLKGLLTLSFLWGLIPCPIALSAIVTSWSSGSLTTVIASVGMFSLGVGSILLTSSLCMVYGSHFFQHQFSQLEPWVNRASVLVAFMLIFTGLYLVTTSFL